MRDKNGTNVIVIGSGVIGSFTAYFLALKNRSVTVLEKGGFGSGASAGNCGLVVPNHILPLNHPANLLKAVLWMFQKDAPLHVQPEFNPRRIRWFLDFAKRCRRKDILASAKGRRALLQSAFRLYPEIIGEENMVCDWKVGGSIHAYRSQRKWAAFRDTDAWLRRNGIAAEPLDPKALSAVEPALKGDLAGGWHYRDTACLRPERLLEELRRLLCKKGVRIVENSEAQGFVVKGDRAVAVRTRAGMIPGDAFVVAAGAWAPSFERELGCRIPIEPGKGFSMTMQSPRNCPRLPLFFEEKSVVATPWEKHFRLGGTMEFSGYEPSLDPVRLEALSGAANRYLRKFKIGKVDESWYGFRPMTVDGLPVIDWSPRLKNVMIAAGHNMVGISMGPSTGKLVAEMLNNDAPHVDPHPYQAGRFAP